MMTNEQKLRALVERLPPPGWWVDRYDAHRWSIVEGAHEADVGAIGETYHPDTAHGLVALRNAAPALLACVEALRAFLKKQGHPTEWARETTRCKLCLLADVVAAFDALQIGEG